MILFLGAVVIVLIVCLWFILKRVEELETFSGKIIAHNAELLEDYTKLHQDYIAVKTQLQSYMDDEQDEDDYDAWEDEEDYLDDFPDDEDWDEEDEWPEKH